MKCDVHSGREVYGGQIQLYRGLLVVRYSYIEVYWWSGTVILRSIGGQVQLY